MSRTTENFKMISVTLPPPTPAVAENNSGHSEGDIAHSDVTG
jgi:hypothetical protein